jgi:hypothetical protein
MKKLSIIIPLYNLGKYLKECLLSIYASNCTIPFDITIVDDCSTDNSYTVAEELQKRFVFNLVKTPRNSHLSGARNYGLTQVDGDVILHIDADDKIPDNYIQEVWTTMVNSEAEVVYTDYVRWEADTGRFVAGPYNTDRLRHGNYIHSASLIKRSLLKKLGGYDEAMKLGWEDYEFYLRASKINTKFEYCTTTQLFYRIRTDSMCRTSVKDNSEKIHQYIANKHPGYYIRKSHTASTVTVPQIPKLSNGTKKELVSVCIPCYEMQDKGDKMLSELLLSIHQQDYSNIEIVVSDHSKNDKIQKLIETKQWRYPIKYFRYKENYGSSSANLNHAIQKAAGYYIKPMFQDDAFTSPTALQEFVQTANGKDWVSCSNYTCVDELQKVKTDLRIVSVPRSLEAMALGDNSYGTPSNVLLLDKTLKFDESLIWLMDCEYYYRYIQKHGLPHIINTPLVKIREWSGSVTNSIASQVVRRQEFEYVKEKHNITLR